MNGLKFFLFSAMLLLCAIIAVTTAKFLYPPPPMPYAIWTIDGIPVLCSADGKVWPVRQNAEFACYMEDAK